MLHLGGPLQEPPQMRALPPGKFPEFQKTNLLHLDPAVGFNPPQQIRTAPWCQAVSPGRIPQESKDVAHSLPRGMIMASQAQVHCAKRISRRPVRRSANNRRALLRRLLTWPSGVNGRASRRKPRPRRPWSQGSPRPCPAWQRTRRRRARPPAAHRRMPAGRFLRGERACSRRLKAEGRAAQRAWAAAGRPAALTGALIPAPIPPRSFQGP
jgi:hypothetical protein